MNKRVLALFVYLVSGPAYSSEALGPEDVPPVENTQENEEPSPADRQIQKRLEQLKKNCAQKKYVERLEKFSESEWDAAGWYLFMLNQLITEGENCEYLKWYDKPQRVNAVTVLELEVEEFLAKHE